ncbi:diphthine methyltransferase [Anopheles nili]|uniref:diphthine methyltransferase n=1 Tax=Anopheles nili TaxID=185578 RepID=UPI00237B15DE|nr:diphthine methyltransferase [Anopheles nili]
MVKLKFNTIAKRDTDQSADSVEWCPSEKLDNIFVCGTYHLERDNDLSLSNRLGRILLYRFEGESQSDPLTLLQTVNRSAVLDQKWNPFHKNRLAVAGADGTLAIYAVEDFSEQPKLDLQTSIALQGEELQEQNPLALAVDWSQDGKRIIVSDSHGCIELLSFENTLQSIHNWKKHGFEAWTCAFSRHNENIVFSGGDDCILYAHDVRCPGEPALKSTNKSHSAGVTSLLSFAQKDNILLTGSYDEYIRLFDERQLKNCVSEHLLHGGVWRLRSNPNNDPRKILCACMYHNFSVVKLLPNDSFELIGEYDEHDSICYGCDWQQISQNDHAKRNFIATCSFYDHKLCVAEVEEYEEINKNGNGS